MSAVGPRGRTHPAWRWALVASLAGCAPSAPPAEPELVERIDSLAAERLEIGLPEFDAQEALTTPRPPRLVADWRSWLGHYEHTARDGTRRVAILHERDGRPALLIGAAPLVSGHWDGDGLALEPNALGLEVVETRPSTAERAAALVMDGTFWSRVAIGPEEGETFRIEPLMSIERLRAIAMAAEPPPPDTEIEQASSELVELVDLEPGLRLEIRYAGSHNFMGAAFYRQPRAFLQRPAAEAVVAAHRELAEWGLGLLIYDGYRPWHVTRMFWDATPEHLREFVADPAQGSRHNRGAAVDLTLYDLATGEPVAMPGGYDEFSVRSDPDYPGGTSLQRWHRDLLRAVMEGHGFEVYENEWWHFDYRDWRRYPVLNLSFEALADGA